MDVRFDHRRVAMVDVVCKAIAQADPMGLLELGAPADEYEAEISAVLSRLPAAQGVGDVGNILTEEFARASGLDEATIRPVLDTIAPRIWEALVEYRSKV